MLNSYSVNQSTNNNFHINAVCGTLVKNYEKSYFLRFQLGSSLEKNLINRKPTVYDETYGDWKSSHRKPVVVVQVMCIGGENGDMFMAEVIDKDDFDKFHNIDSEEEGGVDE